MSDQVQAQTEQTRVLEGQSEERAWIRELGILFHPDDLEHSGVQSAAEVAARFAEVWARLARLARAADLPARGRGHITMAQRLAVQ